MGQPLEGVLDLTKQAGNQVAGWVRNIFKSPEGVEAVVPQRKTVATFSFRRTDGLYVLRSNDPEFVAMMRRYHAVPVIEEGEWAMLVSSQALNIPAHLQDRVQYGAPVPESSFPIIGSGKTSVGDPHPIPSPFK